MSDHELAMTLGLLPKGVPILRALIGSPTGGAPPVRDPRAARISTPIERDTRKFLDRVYGRWAGGLRVDTEDCKLAAEITAYNLICITAEITAHHLIRMPGFRSLSVPPHPPTDPAPWFTPETPEHLTLIRALRLALVCFDRSRELRDGGRGGVAAALRTSHASHATSLTSAK
jgi:hypothetical protein